MGNDWRYDQFMQAVGYDRLLAKCTRTSQHYEELEALISEFLNRDPYDIRKQDDVSRGTRSIRCEFSVAVPLEILTNLGDILYGLRSTLDHVAYHLALRQDPQTTFKPYFPIEETLKKYKAKAAREMQAIGRPAIDLIDTFEPYVGGKGEIFWQLHSANNFAKHCLLPTVAGNIVGHTIPTEHIEQLISTLPSGYRDDAELLNDLMVMPRPESIVTDSTGTTLTIPIPTVEKETRLTLEVVFGEPRILLGKSVLGTMRKMNKAVLNLVEAFRSSGFL